MDARVESQKRRECESLGREMYALMKAALLKRDSVFSRGVPFPILDAECIRGYRSCTLRLNCGMHNSRLYKYLDDSTMPQFVPWNCEKNRPHKNNSGRWVEVDVAWPEHLQRRDVPIDTVCAESTRHGGKLVLGPNADGEVITLPARLIEHLLIGGQTGSGKSVTMQTLTAQLSKPPARNERTGFTPPPNWLILLDGKGGHGLRIVDRLPGQVGPLAIETEDIVNAMGWCVNEMKRRYSEIESLGSGRDVHLQFPHTYILFDEFQFLTKDVAHPVVIECLNVLAAQGRAAGFHVIAGTQKPSVDVFGKGTTTSGQFSAAIGQRVKTFQESKMIVGRNDIRCDQLQASGHAHVVATVPEMVEQRGIQLSYFTERQIEVLPRADPQLEAWPEYDVAGLSNAPKRAGRQRKVTTAQEWAVGFEAAMDGNGVPWFRDQFNGTAPGAGRAGRIIEKATEIQAILNNRGIALRRIDG